jgi:tetratricopeptide (TPR) repeat protein
MKAAFHLADALRAAALALAFLSSAALGDYIEDRQAASALMNEGKHQEAIDAFTAMAEGPVSDFQKADALEQAADCARRLQKFDLADELAGRIPLEAVAKTVRMQNLLALRKPQELVAQFQDEDIDAWPFWKAGEALAARGRAFCDTANGSRAERDLTEAIELTTDDRARSDLWLTIGRNREENLKDDDAALDAYQQIAAMTRGTGSATYYRGIQCTSRILSKKRKFDEAEATLQKVDVDGLKGYWRGSMLLAVGEMLAAAGRKDEAAAACRKLLADDTVLPSHREQAEEAIRTLSSDTR